jgi:hypothetical protein
MMTSAYQCNATLAQLKANLTGMVGGYHYNPIWIFTNSVVKGESPFMRDIDWETA